MNKEIDVSNVKLETERLLLRPFEIKDLDDLYEYAKVPGVGEMAGWNHHQNKEESKIILDMFIAEKKTFAIVSKEDNKVIGSLGIEKYNEALFPELSDYQGREIGFVLSKDYWGQGIMKEAVGAVISYLFYKLSLDFLTCGYYDHNLQSKRVQEKCGFKAYKHALSHPKTGKEEETTYCLLINPKKNMKVIQ